ncbi:MAG: FAD-dependent oxidoreductase [Actinobacteria bacterium]|nr:FAD-dependent oxidoreductase [Actinomycetota bacterium]
MKVVIVGGVAGGASAAARMRRLSEELEIVMLERGEYVSFANCGLPYHIGGDIKRRRDLLIATPEHFREQFEIEVRTGHEVVRIDRDNKSVRVVDHAGGREYDETYDRLVLAQGASAVRPDLPGIGHPRIFALRNIPDMDAVKQLVDGGAGSAVVVGAGYIGLETVEALVNRGLSVDLVELQDHVLPTLDPEMADDLRYHLEEKGVRLRLGAGVESFADAQGRVTVELSDGSSVCADLVVMAIGVTPESALAADAGLELGARGAVKVDAHMRTSDPDIFAAGDMVEVTDTVTGEQTNIPLAGPANRQGRIAADNICGRESVYTTTQGTAIVKVFDLTAAMTGASEKTLLCVGRRFEKIYIYPFGHAIYYPGTGHMHTKVLFDPDDGRILGAQIVGFDGVDKRIDVLAVAVRTGMTVYDLEEQELAYAPPYGSAKDAINMAGFVGANVLKGDVRFWFAEDHPEMTLSGTVLDVRTPKEYEKGHVDGAVLIPVDRLRGRLDELRGAPEPIFIYCLTGIRSYLAYRILHLNGFSDLYNLAGGWKSFERFHRERLEDAGGS